MHIEVDMGLCLDLNLWNDEQANKLLVRDIYLDKTKDIRGRITKAWIQDSHVRAEVEVL